MSSSGPESLLAQLRSLVPLGTQRPSDAQIKQAHDTLRKLKIDLVKLQSGPPAAADQRKLLLWQREMLELACFLSLYAHDTAAFDRYIAQLKTYYNDYRAVLPASPSQGPILGLYLLCLLCHNQIADFHTEYELLAHAATSAANGAGVTAASSNVPPPASPTSSRSVSSSALLSSPFITFPVSLEQQLMEGCYHQMLLAKQQAPLPIYSLFTDMLVETVRNKIADCAEQAYESLTLADLATMLRLAPATDDVRKFVAQRHGWAMAGSDKVLFLQRQEAIADNTEIQPLKTIKQALDYAGELEKIV